MNLLRGFMDQIVSNGPIRHICRSYMEHTEEFSQGVGGKLSERGRGCRRRSCSESHLNFELGRHLFSATCKPRHRSKHCCPDIHEGLVETASPKAAEHEENNQCPRVPLCVFFVAIERNHDAGVIQCSRRTQRKGLALGDRRALQ